MSFIEKAKASGRIFDASIEAGQHLARLAEPCVAKLVSEGEPDERCKSCAFRAGTLPNQCGDTILDAMKCVMEGEPFYCHVNVGSICHGWFASRVATKGMQDITAPWPFSHEEDRKDSHA